MESKIKPKPKLVGIVCEMGRDISEKVPSFEELKECPIYFLSGAGISAWMGHGLFSFFGHIDRHKYDRYDKRPSFKTSTSNSKYAGNLDAISLISGFALTSIGQIALYSYLAKNESIYVGIPLATNIASIGYEWYASARERLASKEKIKINNTINKQLKLRRKI